MTIERILGTDTGTDAFGKTDRNFVSIDAEKLPISHNTDLTAHYDIRTQINSFAPHLSKLVTDVDGVHGLKIEKGTCTLTIAGSTVAGANTYSRNIGHYIKIGDFVQVSGIITMTALDANLAGTLFINGLPFPVANVTNLYNVPAIYTSRVTFGSGYTQASGYFETNRSRIILLVVGSGVAAGTLNQAALAANSEITISLTYRTV